MRSIQDIVGVFGSYNRSCCGGSGSIVVGCHCAVYPTTNKQWSGFGGKLSICLEGGCASISLLIIDVCELV